MQYTATVEFRNAYGELPAAQIAKLPFYGGITLVYAVIAWYVKKNSGLRSRLMRYIASGLSCIGNTDMTYVCFPA